MKANRVGGPTKPYEPPAEPVGKINVTDPDSRNVKSPRGWVQGYNAQAVVNENHVVIAAEVRSIRLTSVISSRWSPMRSASLKRSA